MATRETVATMSRVISADSHVEIPDSAWAEYLDPEFRDQGPRLEVTEDGVFRLFEGSRKAVGAHETLGNQAGTKPQSYGETTTWRAEQRSGASDPEQRIADQDIDGVDAEVLYQGRPLVDATDYRLRLNSFRAYNRWLADFCSLDPNRLIGVAAIPTDTPEIAVEELHAAHAMGFRTAYIPLFPPGGSYSEPDWNPLWQLAAESGTPLGMHIGDLRHGARRFDDAGLFMTENLMARLLMAEALGELILGGVVQRHPALTLVSVEAQIGWLSFALSHMDRVWEKHRFWTHSELNERPSAYFRRQVFATFTDDPVGLREARHIGIDNIMWSSDYPHAETSWPNSWTAIEQWRTDFDEEEQAKLLWRNAAGLYPGVQEAVSRHVSAAESAGSAGGNHD